MFEDLCFIGLATSTGVGGVVSSATTTTTTTTAAAAAAAEDSVRFIRRDRGVDKAEDAVYETSVYIALPEKVYYKLQQKRQNWNGLLYLNLKTLPFETESKTARW